MILVLLIAAVGVGAVLGINLWVKWRDFKVNVAMSKGGGTFTWAGIEFDVAPEEDE